MWLALTVACFLLAVAGHGALCRTRIRLDFVAKSLVVGLPLGVLLIVSQLATYGVRIQTAAAVLLYAFLFELYIFGFTFVSSSVSVSLLLNLGRRTLSSSEIEGSYSSQSMVAGRFERLLAAGLLTRNGDRYHLTPKAKLLVACFRAVRFFFHPHKHEEQAHSR